MTTNSTNNGNALGKDHLYSGRLPKSYSPETFPWHSHASLANSSQVACINAFGHTAELDGGVRDRVFSKFFGAAFPEMKAGALARSWTVGLEYEDRSLLNEFGANQPTSIDALCSTSVDVVAVEAKFDRDAKDGFGCCSQPKADARAGKTKACAGHYGPGSDLRTSANVDCRLEAWESSRSPRLYWVLGRQYFRASALQPQEPGMTCPLAGPSYQLMRNFLFVASFAAREGKKNFGVAVVCPSKRKETLEKQIEEFRDKILLPEYGERIQLLAYDDLVNAMRSCARKDQMGLADHIDRQLNQLA